MIFKLGFLPPKSMILYLIVVSPQEVERGGEVWGLSSLWKVKNKDNIEISDNSSRKHMHKRIYFAHLGHIVPRFYRDICCKAHFSFFKNYIYIYIYFFFFWLTFTFQEYSHAKSLGEVKMIFCKETRPWWWRN